MSLRLGLVVAAFTLSATAAACGASGATRVTTIQDVLANAYATTTSSHTAEMTVSMNVRTATGATTDIEMRGAFQWQPLRAQFAETIPLNGYTLSIQARLIGNEMYMQLPAQFRSHLGGRPWLEASLAGLTGTSGLDSNPTQFLQVLAGRANSITKVGPQSVDGVQTTEYRAEIDLAKSATTPFLRSLAPKLEAVLGTDVLPVYAWVDPAGRLVRAVIPMTLERAPAGAAPAVAAQFPISEAVTEDLSDYGAPVDVTAPPPSQISSFDLQRLLQNSL
jgi:hypothetical protein